jgi:hypothetical protein
MYFFVKQIEDLIAEAVAQAVALAVSQALIGINDELTILIQVLAVFFSFVFGVLAGLLMRK